MRHNILIIINTLISNFEKKIILINEEFVWNAIFRLIYSKKANLIYHKNIKKNINILYNNKISEPKQSKLNTTSANKIKPSTKYILILT